MVKTFDNFFIEIGLVFNFLQNLHNPLSNFLHKLTLTLLRTPQNRKQQIASSLTQRAHNTPHYILTFELLNHTRIIKHMLTRIEIQTLNTNTQLQQFRMIPYIDICYVYGLLV